MAEQIEKIIFILSLSFQDSTLATEPTVKSLLTRGGLTPWGKPLTTGWAS